MYWLLVHMKAVAIVVALVLRGAVVGAQPLDNIIAYWPADGNADDVVGGNDGTLEGGASFGAGKVGQAFDLTGTRDLVRMSQPIQFAQGEDFTVNFWVNQAVSPPDGGFIFETRAGQFLGFAILTLPDNRIFVGGRCDNASVAYNVASETVISNGQWHHVAAVFDWSAAELRLYVDGCLDNMSSLSACNGFTSSDKLFVGAISSLDIAFNFNGLVDELQVYERALTDLDIEVLFEQADEVAVCGRKDGPSIDIKPGSCPNSFNRNSHGVLPVALVGTVAFDVAQVDISSILLSRADGVGGSVAPNEGPPGPHSVFEDVATPFEGELCDCHELKADGATDLSMKFRTDDVVNVLELNDLPAGDVVQLVLSGALFDGTPFSASDCVRLVPLSTPPG